MSCSARPKITTSKGQFNQMAKGEETVQSDLWWIKKEITLPPRFDLGTEAPPIGVATAITTTLR